MTDRYVVTSSTPDAEPVAIAEDESVRVVAQLDRGVLVDAEPGRVDELAASGLRVKALPDPHVLTLFGHRIDTRDDVTPELEESLRAPETDVNHLVQLVGPAQDSWLAAIAGRGVRVVEAVGPFAYYVRAEPDAVAGLRELPFVAWTGRLEPGYKVNPVLLPGAAEAEAAPTPGLGPIEALDIGVLADGDVDAVVALVEGLGGTVDAVAPATADVYRSVTAQLPADAIPVVAARPDVRWVDVVRTPVPEDERTAQIAFEDLDAAAPPTTAPLVGYGANLTGLGADGAGVTIAICDTGIDTNVAATVHPDLAGRLAFAVSAATGAAPGGGDTNGHGTHVAGIAAGDNGSGATDPQGFGLGQGLAPGARVGSVISDGTPQQRIQLSVQNGARVMNNSYALNGSTYGAVDRTFDLGVRDANPGSTDIEQLVVVFSAGNSGPGADTCTKAVKNALVVGNSLNFRPGEGTPDDDIRGLRRSSSRGPAADGRLLPTLVAPGTDVVSALSTASAEDAYVDTAGTVHNQHTVMSGTSMAAPVVSGMCAVLIDWWRQTRGGATPSPALLKALLVVATEPVTGGPDGNSGTIAAGPTNDAGWGRVSLENSLLQVPASDRGPKIFVDQRHAFTASGQEFRIRVAADDPARPLRVALTWTDAAGAVGANPALVNDLDLEVLETTTGNVYRGNVFAGAFSTPGGVADALNNVECVAVANPNGVYEVSVVAASIGASARPDIATPWQDFALVIDNGEVPAAAPVSVVTVLDHSGSMQAYGYVDVTRQTSRQFVDLMSVDDAVGVVSFGDAAVQQFPAAGGPEIVVGQATRDAATAAIDGVAFGGCTFMGAGIETAGTMLAGAGNRRAAVLLSDGFDNKGCDPGNPARPSALQAVAALPAGLPLYTCAMGPAADQTLLAQLAAGTAGRYYFMPTIDDLFEIYNFIRGQVTSEGIIVNESAMASRSVTSAFVDACTEAVTFTVAWHDTTLRYVPREPRKPDEISVRLRAPGGRWLPHSATEVHRTVGTGYVSLAVEEPRPGSWTVEVVTAREVHTPYTVAGFVRSALLLRTNVAHQVALGEPADLEVAVSDADGPVVGLSVRATVDVPARDIRDVVADHRGELADVVLAREVLADLGRDDELADLVRLVVLRDRVLAETGKDIVERTRTPVLAVVDPQAGTAVGRLPMALVPGSRSVAITATGFSAACRTRFVRRDLVSQVARD